MMFLLAWICCFVWPAEGGVRITEHPASCVVRRGVPATLRCGAEGGRRITWYRDGVALGPDTPNRMVLPSGSLFFLHVLPGKDAGAYWCEAEDGDGATARSRNATLDVAVLRDEFRVWPRGVSVSLGESALLECVPPRGHPEPEVRWRKDGAPLAPSARIAVLPPGNLQVSDVRQSDEGQYTCVAENAAGVRESPPAPVAVHVKPFFVREPDHVSALSAERVRFECRVGGDPMPTVTWRRQDGRMPLGRAQIQEADKSLLLRDVEPADEGTYICEAENPGGIISAAVTLTVHSRPSFVQRPRDQRVGLNGVAKFECAATGNPPPSVFWTKEGNQVLMFPERAYGRLGVSREGALVISGVTREDAGHYVCSALSAVGADMARAHLQVTAVGDLPPPVILLGPANQTLPLSTGVSLPCEAAGTPTPRVRWSGPALRHPRARVLDSGTLRIEALQPTDSGLYTCTATSESGETSWSASLAVESPRNPNVIFHRAADPSTFPRPPGRPAPLNVTETAVTLHWARSERGASPLLGYRVEYSSSDLQSGWVVSAHHVTGERHTVSDLRPGTRYQFLVRAENAHGLSPPSPPSETIRTTPLPPHGGAGGELQHGGIRVQLTDVRPSSSTALRIRWKIEGGSVEGFYIRFREGGGKYGMVTVLKGGGASGYVLSGLRKHTEYELFLVPFRDGVEGPPSNSRRATTLEDVPSAPPDALHAEILGPDSAALSWSSPPPQHINGALKGYVVEVWGAGDVLHANVSTNATTTRLLLTNLTAGATYRARAGAYTSAGPGPPTPFLSIVVAAEEEAALWSAALRQPWSVALLGAAVFVALSVFLVAVFVRRRRAWNKATLLHHGTALVSLHKADGMRGGEAALWINQTLNSSQGGQEQHNYYSVCAPDYAEVDYQQQPAAYATTALVATAYDSKSSSSDLSKKSDINIRMAIDDVFDHFLNKSQACSSVNYANGCSRQLFIPPPGRPAHQRGGPWSTLGGTRGPNEAAQPHQVTSLRIGGAAAGFPFFVREGGGIELDDLSLEERPANEYSNFIAAAGRGRRPPSGAAGHHRKKEDVAPNVDDIPSYQKPSFPSAPSRRTDEDKEVLAIL